MQSDSENMWPKKGEFIVRVTVAVGDDDYPKVSDFVSNMFVNDSRGVMARQALEVVALGAFKRAGVALYQPDLLQSHDPSA